MNIDDLLRKELTNLKADAPADAWQNINTKLNVSAQPSPANPATNTVTTVAKSAAISVKTIALTIGTIAAIGAITYFAALVPSKPGHVQQIASPTTIIADAPPVAEVDITEQNKNENGETQVSTTKPTVAKSTKTNQPKTTSNTQTSGGENVINANEEGNHHNQSNQNQTAQYASKPAQENKEFADMPISPKRIAENVNNSTNNYEEDKTVPQIPNVFTPFHAEGSNGLNDEFVITIENDVLFDLKITDATGNTVFETKDKNQHWKGYNQLTGAECKQGVYVYALRYQVLGMKEPRVTKGKLTLQQ